MNEIVYTPKSALTRPGEFLRAMFRDLHSSHGLARELMTRDIKALYRQSLLGYAWALIPPILAALGMVMARDANIVNIVETPLPYPAYVAFSTALWQTFVESVAGPIAALGAARPLMARINFPREALFMAKIGEILFNFMIKLALITGLFLVYDMPVTWHAFLAPLGLASLIIFGTFTGLVLAPISVLFEDVKKGLIFLTSAWMLLTPVIYPQPSQGFMAVLVRYNPVTPLLNTTRELATTGQVADWTGFITATVIGTVGLFVFWMVFRMATPYLTERISA